MDPRAALLDLTLAVEPLVRRQATVAQRRAHGAWRRALATLAPDRAGADPRRDAPPDAEALVRAYYAAGGSHDALIAAISRLRWIDHEDTRS
ncbi:hypothetical protein [Roseospira navarrensis]|uniref:Uncharacterized protein n=1 Tax=Roseospira navarrensis TaxID=140058 RepID=A0A7X1ZGL0_9PROT|nr:hypothetical protein [Roseospira navarrensis]MQX36840.1 hypothetical protein [Roseospira navarrensis]